MSCSENKIRKIKSLGLRYVTFAAFVVGPKVSRRQRPADSTASTLIKILIAGMNLTDLREAGYPEDFKPENAKYAQQGP